MYFKFSVLKSSVLIILISFTAIISYGQVTEKIAGFAVNPKLGAYDWAGDNIGLARGIELNVLFEKYMFSIDYYNTMQVLNDETFNLTGIMAGWYSGKGKFRLQYQCGAGFLWGINETGYSANYKKEDILAVGIPLKLGFKFLAARFVSLGIDFQVNINTTKSIYMTFGSIEFGRVRDN